MEKILTAAGGRNRCGRYGCHGGAGGVVAPSREAVVARVRLWVHRKPTWVSVRRLSMTIKPPIVRSGSNYQIRSFTRQIWIGEKGATVLTRSCGTRKACRRTSSRTQLWDHGPPIGGEIMRLVV